MIIYKSCGKIEREILVGLKIVAKRARRRINGISGDISN